MPKAATIANTAPMIGQPGFFRIIFSSLRILSRQNARLDREH
jgi:hypothetical protein